MAIKLPAFQDALCKIIVVSGTLETDEKEVLAVIEELKGETLVAPYSIGKKKAYVRLTLGGLNPGHLHVDALRREAFGDEPPKNLRSRKEIDQILSKFVGQGIKVNSYALFVLPVAELPKGGLIRSTFFETELGELSIKVSSAEFSIKGAPIDNIRWRFMDDGASVMVQITARAKTTVGEDYLEEQRKLLEDSFRVLGVGRTVG